MRCLMESAYNYRIKVDVVAIVVFVADWPMTNGRLRDIGTISAIKHITMSGIQREQMKKCSKNRLIFLIRWDRRLKWKFLSELWTKLYDKVAQWKKHDMLRLQNTANNGHFVHCFEAIVVILFKNTCFNDVSLHRERQLLQSLSNSIDRAINRSHCLTKCWNCVEDAAANDSWFSIPSPNFVH